MQVWRVSGVRTGHVGELGGLMLNFLALVSWSLHHLYAHTRICEQMTWHRQKTLKIMPLPLARPV